MLEPPLAGLTNSGQPSVGDLVQHPLGLGRIGSRRVSAAVPGPVPLADHHVRPDRQAPGREDQLHVLLVHADRAGQHARADVRHPGHLQQSLDRAVLAVRAVQHRQHHVDLAEQVRDLRRRAG